MEFVIYSKNDCPYCTRIKQILSMKGYTYKEFVYEKDFDKQTFYEKFGQNSTFPQVVYENHNLGGCKDTIEYLKQNNLL